jgi:hypothetical protein
MVIGLVGRGMRREVGWEKAGLASLDGMVNVKGDKEPQWAHTQEPRINRSAIKLTVGLTFPNKICL